MKVKVEPYNEEYLGVFWKVVDEENNILESGFESTADAEDWAISNGHSLREKKIYRTVIRYEILSEEPLPESIDLETIAYETRDGSWSGRF